MGAILDPAGSQGGSKNHVFGYHVGKMMKKGCPKTRPEKTSKFDWNLVPKWEGLGGENERFAGDMLQNKGFRGIVKYWENCCQKGSKKRPKSEPKTLPDQIFEIFSRFGRSRNLDVFWEKKMDHKSEKVWKLRLRSKTIDILRLARQSVRTRLRLWSLSVLDFDSARFVPREGA